MRIQLSLGLGLALALGVLAAPRGAVAQTSDPNADLLVPDRNVSAGGIAERRPGNWVQAGIAEHEELANLSFSRFHGAEYRSIEDVPPSRGKQIKLALLEGLFDVLNQMATAMRAALALRAGQNPLDLDGL